MHEHHQHEPNEHQAQHHLLQQMLREMCAQRQAQELILALLVDITTELRGNEYGERHCRGDNK